MNEGLDIHLNGKIMDKKQQKNGQKIGQKMIKTINSWLLGPVAQNL
jgi:hypothetical protein